MSKLDTSEEERRKNMNIIHIMADGSVRDSVKGLVIQNEEFYRVVQRILERRQKEKEAEQ